MLRHEEITQLLQESGFSEEAQDVIKIIRASEPSRRVMGNANNVCVRYASRKMGRIIQAESHRNELAGIYEMEHDDNVLEFYDQPPQIKITYYSKLGKKVAPLYTPDFFIIQREPDHSNKDKLRLSAGWVEWKMEEELKKLAVESPNRYVKGEDERWHCPPGEEYAAQFGFFFHLRSSAEIDWIFQRNMRFLEDYLQMESPLVSVKSSEEILSLVTNEPGITLNKLLKSLKHAVSDDIYTLIATEQIYADMYAAPLAEPDRPHIFRDAKTAEAYVVLITESYQQAYDFTPPVTVAIGISVLWDGKGWMIVNEGKTHISLLASTGDLVELPRNTLEGLIRAGKITSLDKPPPSSVNAEEVRRILTSDKKDLEQALKRYYAIKPYLDGSPPQKDPISDRTIRYWIAKYRKSEQACGKGLVGLLSQRLNSGNRGPKLAGNVLNDLDEYISTNYETLKQQSMMAVYRSYQAQRKKDHKYVPSYKTFTIRVKMRDSYTQTKKRKGEKAAYPEEPVYWELEVTTPRHGDRPFEIVHIDHTQLDIEIIDSRTKKNLGRPWVTFMVDAYSRRILAFYLTFDSPSYRSCMMILRECVRRHGRLPQSIVTDGGKEFNSTYFEALLAFHQCSLYKRPWAKPHYGSVCERLFNTMNTTFVHNLIGNTQIMKNVRQVTKSINPKELACWTLGSFYNALYTWAYEVYDNTDHFTLGQAPGKVFELGLIQGGIRPFKHIPYNEDFKRDTLPTTSKGKAKVQHTGVKINHIYYYCDAFRTPGVVGTEVLIRYDPFDIGKAYAFVKGEWTLCISEYQSAFAGRSEREIDIATKILRKRNKDSAKNYTVTSASLAAFISSLEAEEVLLLQQMHDMETTNIIAYINGQDVAVPNMPGIQDIAVLDIPNPSEVDEDEEVENVEKGNNISHAFKQNEHTYTLYEDF